MYGPKYIETDKTKELPYGMLNPHYTDERFRSAQTVFLAPGRKLVHQFGTESVKGVSYEYSDRLLGWHGKKCDEAWEKAGKKGFAKSSPALIEAYLQELFDDPKLQLVHLLTGFNLSDGYPYRVYGYIRGGN